MKFKVFLRYVILVTFFANSPWIYAEESQSISSLLKQWNTEIEKTSEKLKSQSLNDEKLKQLRGRLTEIRDQARSSISEIDSALEPIIEELETLGPVPAEGEPKEAASISEKRKLLDQRLATMEGQGKEVGLLVSQVEKVLKQISTIRIDRFTKATFTRGVSVLTPELWRKASHDLVREFFDTKKEFKQWQTKNISNERLSNAFFHLVIAVLVSWLVSWSLGKWISRKFTDISTIPSPNSLELIHAALTVMGLKFLFPMLVSISMYLVITYNVELTNVGWNIVYSILMAILMVALVSAASRALLSPYRSHRRLLPMSDRGARFLHRIVLSLAGVFSFDLILGTWLNHSGASLEIIVIRKFVIGLLISGALLSLVSRRLLWLPLTLEHKRLKGKTLLWGGLRSVITILALLIPLSAIAGYVTFSRLLATQIVLTGGLFILVSIVIALCSELTDELFSIDTEIGKKIRLNLSLNDESSELFTFWIKATLNLIIYLSAILVLLVLWGAGGEDITEWLYKAIFGFKVAGVTVSIASIFIAIALFSGILIFTRILQNILEHRIMPKTRIDFGIQHSIRASVGYIGFIIATLFAISTLGIDLSKLAIIAGALSVGIGFGLQNVVNNFISGLILLVERPIKVGDWIVVGDKQGLVKKIKVRATEIQTFDRATVFIPNSDMISNPLQNWTHADKTARVIVPVGVAYGTDTRKVQEILLEVASNHPGIFKVPAPSAIFKGFGDSSLNFELRAFIGDTDKLVSVNSDLCFAIDAAFREEGIEIPYPQQDVHWKDMEKLENLVMRMSSEKKL